MEEVKKILPIGPDGKVMIALPEKDQKWILCKASSYVQKFVSKKLGNRYTFYHAMPGGKERPLLIKYQEDIDELLSNPLFVEVRKLGDVVEELVNDMGKENKDDELVKVESVPDYSKEQLELLKSKALNPIIKGLTDDPIPKSKYDKINLILEIQESD